MNNVVVKMDKITKQFGKLVANKETTLEIRKGEVHALLGENGAGKSTLMNILAGVYKQTSGEIYIGGNKVLFNSPLDALNAGIGMIYQHYKLVENMTALDNVIGGNAKEIFINRRQKFDELTALCESTGLKIDLNKQVAGMSISEKQTLEIIKVLYKGANILILDEPTAVLTPQETKNLFGVIKTMKEQGKSIIIITHKLNEIMENTDRVTVLRAGQNITTVDTKASSPVELTHLMVGENTSFEITRNPCQSKKIKLEASHMTYVNEDRVKVLDDVSFHMFEGEVLGVAGVAGSGQKQLCEVLSGILPIAEGEVIHEGYSIIHPVKRSVNQKQVSVGFVPENRLSMGLVGDMDMVDNIMLRYEKKEKGMFLKKKPVKEICKHLIEKLEIKTMGMEYPVKMMSGGNIQKVLLGREMMRQVDYFIVAYPVRGLDVAASHTVYNMLDEIKQKGVPILFIGEDLDHLLAFSDRIMVMCQGKVTGIVEASETTKEAIGEMMAGHTRGNEEEAMSHVG